MGAASAAARTEAPRNAERTKANDASPTRSASGPREEFALAFRNILSTSSSNYRRTKAARPRWQEFVCGEANPWLTIGKDTYYLSSDGYLMPTRKDQSPPDTHYFARPGK